MTQKSNTLKMLDAVDALRKAYEAMKEISDEGLDPVLNCRIDELMLDCAALQESILETLEV